MKVFIVQYRSKVVGVFSTWEKVEEFIDKQVLDTLPDFSLSTEEVQ